MLAEYGTLRQESLEAVGHRMTVMSFTFAAVGVIIGGLLTRKVSDAVAGLIAVLFVPQVSKAALLIWLGEYERSQRAGKWLAELEQRVNRALGADALAWETTLLAARRTTAMEAAGSSRTPVHMGYPYVSVVALVVVVLVLVLPYPDDDRHPTRANMNDSAATVIRTGLLRARVMSFPLQAVAIRKTLSY